MTRYLSLHAGPADEGTRLDAFLATACAYPSRSSAVKNIESGKVLVNGSQVAKKYIIVAGDTVVYEPAEEQTHIPLEGEPIPLDVRFEDDCMMVISKQAGLCVHPSPHHYGSTLVNALVYHCGRDQLAHVQGDDRPGIVHRLDMETSGLMLCAKDDETGFELQDMIRRRVVDRRYITLVHGNIAHDTGMIDQPIARMRDGRVRMGVSDREGSRSAVTTFTVLERFEAQGRDNGYTLLECKLFSGRTHQIRVHMQYIKHCCVGDPMYGSGSDAIQLGLDRQFLHSYSLIFDHPQTEEEMVFIDALPPDLSRALDSISDRSMGRTQAGQDVFSLLEHAASQPIDVATSMM